MIYEQERQEFSKSFFGGMHRLDIMSTIATKRVEPPEAFFLKGVQEELGFGSSAAGSVQRELKKLAALGMIRELPNEHTFTVEYVRTDSPAWAIVNTATDAVDGMFPSDSN